MTDEEFECALKLEDSTARTVTWENKGRFYSKIMTSVYRPSMNKEMWVTRLTTSACASPGYAIHVLKQAFIDGGLSPL